MELQVKFKKLTENAVTPTYANQGDAGLDLTAVSLEFDKNENYVYGTGIAMEIPEGYVGLIFPRSSNRKTLAYLTNSVGMIDSGYRGEIMVSFKCRDKDTEHVHNPYKVGDKIAQIMIIPYPTVQLLEVEQLSDSIRGTKGHGSSGN